MWRSPSCFATSAAFHPKFRDLHLQTQKLCSNTHATQHNAHMILATWRIQTSAHACTLLWLIRLETYPHDLRAQPHSSSEQGGDCPASSNVAQPQSAQSQKLRPSKTNEQAATHVLMQAHMCTWMIIYTQRWTSTWKADADMECTRSTCTLCTMSVLSPRHRACQCDARQVAKCV